VAQYQAALRAVDPAAEPGFVSLEGYLAGRLVVRVLREIGESGEDPPTREAFLQWLEQAGPIDLDGFTVEYGPGDNQGSDAVFLTVIRDGRFVSVNRLSR
jgi:ABC-type branched-subunit amino acid transport system substrate-binding protein